MRPIFKEKKPTFFPPSLEALQLTFALLAGRLVLGVAVEAWPTALAVLAFRVAQAPQASAAHVVAHPQGIEVHVAVALAPLAWANLPGPSQRVAVMAVFTGLAADAYTCWVGRGRGMVKVEDC